VIVEPDSQSLSKPFTNRSAKSALLFVQQIVGQDFFGPDRRARIRPGYIGPDRRKKSPKKTRVDFVHI